MTQTNTTTAIPAIVMTNAAANAAALSAAPTPAGSAYSSPAVSVKGLAPKKLLVRQPLKASFKIKSRTVFPSTERPVKMPNAQMIRGKEEDQLPIVRGTDAHEDALITNNLPANPYRKKDQYDNPYYRAWAPVTEWGGGCPLEHRMMVLVHFAPMGLETEEDKPADTYMNFETYKRHCMGKGIKEWPTGVQFGADLLFYEDERTALPSRAPAGSRSRRRGASAACGARRWRTWRATTSSWRESTRTSRRGRGRRRTCSVRWGGARWWARVLL